MTRFPSTTHLFILALIPISVAVSSKVMRFNASAVSEYISNPTFALNYIEVYMILIIRFISVCQLQPYSTIFVFFSLTTSFIFFKRMFFYISYIRISNNCYSYVHSFNVDINIDKCINHCSVIIRVISFYCLGNI